MKHFLNYSIVFTFITIFLFHYTSAQYRLSDNDSVNSYLIHKIEFLRSYGTAEQIDVFIDELYSKKESKYENNILLIVNILKSRNAVLNNNFQEVFEIIRHNSEIKSSNHYLNTQKNLLEGLYYLLADSVEKAVDVFFRSAYFEGVHDTDFLFLSNYYVAQILYKQENYFKARDFFHRAIVYAFFIKNFNKDNVYLFNRLQELFSNIALCYLKTDDLPMARYYFQSCKEYINKSRDILILNKQNYEPLIYNQLVNFLYESMGVLKGNMGNLYVKSGLVNEGLEYLKESIQINEKIGFDQRDAFITAGHLIVSYFENDKPDSALMYMDLYFDKIIEFSLHKSIADISFYSMKYYLDENLEKSKYFLKLYEKSKKSNQTIKRGKSFFENYVDLLDAKYNLIFENEKLKQEKILQREKYIKLIYIVIIFILFFVLLLYFYFNVKLKNRNIVIEGYNKELNNINEKLNEVNLQKSGIMSMVAHDLRGPINSITSLNELRRDNLISSNEFNLYLIKLVENANSVIQDIINFVKSEKKLEDKMFSNICVKEIIETTILEMQSLYTSKKIMVETSIEEIYINSDQVLFKRLFHNIFSNAIKFSNENTKITIAAFKDNEKLILKITDQGIGMSDEMLKILFEPFTRASRVGTANEPTHGLGMSIVKKIVELHGGTIKVESKIDFGTTIEIQLPIY
ncbi:tetratricopeptide repeat-containing sensor histidine kinase [Schleiferia thermophila]|uniref:ATP-binding protein n=1 Tax=Schleiferia thermophila TaxID=884107 RepID=UPI002FDA5BE3